MPLSYILKHKWESFFFSYTWSTSVHQRLMKPHTTLTLRRAEILACLEQGLLAIMGCLRPSFWCYNKTPETSSFMKSRFGLQFWQLGSPEAWCWHLLSIRRNRHDASQHRREPHPPPHISPLAHAQNNPFIRTKLSRDPIGSLCRHFPMSLAWRLRF